MNYEPYIWFYCLATALLYRRFLLLASTGNISKTLSFGIHMVLSCYAFRYEHRQVNLCAASFRNHLWSLHTWQPQSFSFIPVTLYVHIIDTFEYVLCNCGSWYYCIQMQDIALLLLICQSCLHQSVQAYRNLLPLVVIELLLKPWFNISPKVMLDGDIKTYRMPTKFIFFCIT